MSLKQLKETLSRAGVRHDDCFEKSELVARAREQRRVAREAPGAAARADADRRAVALCGSPALAASPAPVVTRPRSRGDVGPSTSARAAPTGSRGAARIRAKSPPVPAGSTPKVTSPGGGAAAMHPTRNRPKPAPPPAREAEESDDETVWLRMLACTFACSFLISGALAVGMYMMQAA